MFGRILRNLRETPSMVRPTVGEYRNMAEEVTIRLESRLDHLELACAALWEILKSRHGWTDEDLVAAIQEVDARDGVIDGKMGQAVRVCPYCNRKLLSRDSPKCSWCGSDLPTGIF